MNTLLSTSVFCALQKNDELELIEVKHPKCQASLCLQGAHLLSFKPTNQLDYLWLSSTAQYKQGASIRGGIPVCWPWFGVVEKNPTEVQQHIQSTQAHGFARTLNWQLESLSESVHGVDITLSLEHSEHTLKLWPFKFKLQAHFHFSEQLTVRLETHNLDQKDMAFTQALHSYFPTPDITQTLISGANGSSYVDALDGWQEKQQVGQIQFQQEVDRIYKTGGPFQYEVNNQRFELSTNNSQSSIIWNPWVNKSKTLSQFSHEDYQSMFCIESANALDDFVTLNQNQSHCLTMTLKTI